MMRLSLFGRTPGAIRANRLVLALATVALVAAATGGCKKKDGPGVEPVSTGSKPPVVKRKPKDVKAAEPAAAATPAAAGEPTAGLRPPPPEPVAAPVPAPASPATAPEAIVAPALAAAAQPAPEPLPAPPAAPMGAPAPAELAANAGGRPPRAGPNPLGGADPGAAAPETPDRPQPVPEPPPRMPEPVAAPALPQAPREPGEPALDITGYLSAADLERVLGAKTKLRRSDLAGTAPSAGYNAIYFAPDKGDGFGIALQVWRDANLAESRTRFNTMRNTYSNVAPTNKVAEQGFRAYFNGVVTLVFANVRRPLVAALSCSTKVCNADQIIELANRANERLQ